MYLIRRYNRAMLTLSHTAGLSASTHISLNAFLKQQRELWNAALQERIDACKKAHKSISNYDQYKSLTEIRQDDEEYGKYHAQCQRSSLNKLHQSFTAFFSRVKKGEKPGFPRFRGRNRSIDSFDMPTPIIRKQGQYRVLSVKGIGKFRFIPRKGYESVPIKAARVVVTPCRVTVQLIVENTLVKDQGQSPFGIDLGIKARITLSNGAQYAKRIRDKDKLVRLQKRLSKAVRGAKTRDKKRVLLAKENQRRAQSERNLLHRTTTALVRSQSNKFYLEKLNIRGMMKNHTLAKAIMEQTGGMFKEQLAYKAENAGGWVKIVNPKNTSRLCNECQCMPDIKLTLADRTYRCRHCGYVGDRDVSAAMNIFSIGLVSDWLGGNTPACGKNEKQGGLVEPSYHTEQYN